MRIITSKRQRWTALLIVQTMGFAASWFYHNNFILLAIDVPLIPIFWKLIDWANEYQIIGDKPE